MVYQDTEWSLASAAQPLAWMVSFCSTCLIIAASPQFDRWAGVFLLLAPAYGALQTSAGLTPDYEFNNYSAMAIIMLWSYMLAFCFMPNARSSLVQDKAQEFSQSWRRAWKQAFNSRRVGMVGEIPYLWPEEKSTTVFANDSPNLPKDKPLEAPASKHNLASRSKWPAVFIRLAYLLLNSFLLEFYHELKVPVIVGTWSTEDMAPEKSGILRRLFRQFLVNDRSTLPVTGREIKVRALITSHMATTYLSLSSYHDLFAIIFIIAGIDQSWEWPPLFGTLSDAYTMRGFWTKFWHRLIYKSFNFHVSTISSTLGIPRGTTFSRIFNNCLVFFLSALMHAAVSWQHGNPCAWTIDSLMVWCIQPLSLVLEGLVQYTWSRFRKNSLWWVNPAVVTIFERLIGYTWVIAWLMWSVPKKEFADQHCRV